MKRCEDFEVAIEMRLHGALDADGERAVDTHLASCADCRAFWALASNTEETLKNETAMTLDSMDWKRFEGDYRRWLRTLHLPWWRYVLAAGVAVASGALVQWMVLEGRSIGVGGVIGLLAGLILVLAPWRTRRLRAEARLAERTRGTLVSFYRQQLDRRIAREDKASWGVLAIAWLPWVDLPATAAGAAGSVAYTLAFLGLFAYTRWHLLPRLRRERAELE